MNYYLIYISFTRIIILLILCPSFSWGQTFYSYQRESNFTLLTGIGLSKYFGELSDDRRLGDFNPAISIGTEISLIPGLFLRSELLYYRISAADKDLPEIDSRRERNLSFRSNNLELGMQAVFPFTGRSEVNKQKNRIQLYAVGGIAVTVINPQALLDENWYNLKDLKTEGKTYSSLVLAIPLGAGVSYQILPDLALGAELNYRFTLSDYLDDVSTAYLPFESFNDPIAAQLSDRRPEIGLERAVPGNIRGNAANNDGYFIMSIRAKWSFSGQNTPVRRKR